MNVYPSYPRPITIQAPRPLQATLDQAREKLDWDRVRREMIGTAAFAARRERDDRIAAALHFQSTLI